MELIELKKTLENDYRVKKLNLKQFKCYDKLFDEYVKFKEILFERSRDGFCYNAVKYDKISNKVLVCLTGANSPIAETFYESNCYFHNDDKLSFDYSVFDLTNEIDSFIKYLIELAFTGGADTEFDGCDELSSTKEGGLDYKVLFRLLDDEKIESVKELLNPIFGDASLHISEYLLLHDLSRYEDL